MVTASSTHLIAFHSFHEEVWDPHCKEQVSGSLLLFTCVLLQLQEVKHIEVPRLQVDGKGPGSLNRRTRRVGRLNCVSRAATSSSICVYCKSLSSPCCHPGQHNVPCCCTREASEPSHWNCHLSGIHEPL